MLWIVAILLVLAMLLPHLQPQTLTGDVSVRGDKVKRFLEVKKKKKRFSYLATLKLLGPHHMVLKIERPACTTKSLTCSLHAPAKP